MMGSRSKKKEKKNHSLACRDKRSNKSNNNFSSILPEVEKKRKKTNSFSFNSPHHLKTVRLERVSAPVMRAFSFSFLFFFFKFQLQQQMIFQIRSISAKQVVDKSSRRQREE